MLIMKVGSMQFLKIFGALFVALQAMAVSASPIENFKNTTSLTVKSEDYFAVLEDVCNAGSPDYCQRMAFILEKMKDVKLNRDKIISFHQAALNQYQDQCNRNDLVACQEVTTIYQLGYGREIDIPNTNIARDKFNVLSIKLCETEDALGCAYVSYKYNASGDPEYDVIKAHKYSDLSVEYFTKECANQIALSCERLAHRYTHGNTYGGYIPYDIQSALKMFESACQYGLASSCIELSNIYYLGTHVKRDKLKKYQYDKRGCDLDSAISCSNLLNSGKSVSGVKRDKAQTEKLRERMAFLAKTNCAKGKLPECSLIYFR